ncbi:MAG: DNA polymerase III subunit gamma/tau, partial [Acidimicrobiia bacterium]|nr:DNA polymerase III subunit gamma/tau [Acidimicrobiia bacterium]
MGHQSLYRRYRSQTFAEIKGQPVVTNALRTAVAQGRHGHAYLFSGPRGTGKTSTARVLAKALNCENPTNGEPDGTCASCKDIESGRSFDLHELDAASNNKVDDIRELINRVALGSPGRTKVYILDEVHMLSSGAENALLKTLEEPPDHVVFVLATTEPQKVVPTIRSRTQHFRFQLLPAAELEAHLRWVIADAGLDVDDEGIAWALKTGGGSARDALSALDLVVASGGAPETTNTGADLCRAVAQRDPAAAIAVLHKGLEIGSEPRIMGEDMLAELRSAFLASMNAPLPHLNDAAADRAHELAQALGPAAITRSMEKVGAALVEVRQAPDPRVPIEIALLQLARADGDDTAALLQRIERLEQRMEELAAGGG